MVDGRPLHESELIERARRGDLGAYKALIDMHEGIASRTAYLVTRNEADAADAVQEAFYRAYAALRRFRPGAPFRPWLLRIVGNEARDRRDAGARAERIVLREIAQQPLGEAPSGPEAVAVAHETRAEVVAALNRLCERDRIVVACRYFLDLSEEETASLLQVPRGTVKSRLSRALDRLRDELEVER